MTRLECTVKEIGSTRLDKYLSDCAGIMTRSQLKERVVYLAVNGKAAKLSTTVKEGDSITVEYDTPSLPHYEPEYLPLDIIYEDNDVILVNKARGVVVHPAAGNHTGTLVQGLMYHISDLSGKFQGDRLRPGIVHRLDKDTSGIIIAAKHPEALEYLGVQFRKKQVRKTYLALVKGTLYPGEGIIEKGIIRDPGNRKKFTTAETGGKPALTRYKVLRRFESGSFVMLMPETGRTHQLRVHMLSRGAPILGDPVYSRHKDKTIENLMLHAYMLKIRLPGSDSVSVFHAPVPRDFKDALLYLAGKL